MRTLFRRFTRHSYARPGCLAPSERDQIAGCVRDLPPVWGWMWTLRVVSALSCSIMLPLLAPAQPANPAPAAAQPTASTAPADTPAPPPSAPPKLSAAELEKLLMPIALY